MPEQPVVEATEAPYIPRPDANPTALRAALSRISPSQVKEFDRQLVEASTKAQTNQSLGPLWLFCRSWAQFIEVERHPDIARRQAELLAMVEDRHPDAREAISEISRILAWADARLGR
ncbi:DUF6247 family protein [Nocardiopsis sp. NPDC049922]|uniref:DUF6247 family protein n=1 Tax=Nocardiopsis sp. NPDC049922 TaxID=3155157 RepID=UPI0033F0DF67